MATKLEFTKFKHINPVYTPLNRGSIAVHSCKITFENTEVIKLDRDYQIVYSISKRLVSSKDESQVKILLTKATYSINQFNNMVKNSLKGDQWIPPEIKDYKLIIPENFTFIATQAFYDLLGVTPENRISLIKGEYQTKLKPSPKKIDLYCEELASLHNQIDCQPSTKLFSLDAKQLHYEPFNPIYLQLSAPPIFSLHFTLVDENRNRLIPKTFNIIILYNKA